MSGITWGNASDNAEILTSKHSDFIFRKKK